MMPPENWKRRAFTPWGWPLHGGGFVAHHEAGHLVIARALGLPATGAAIFEAGGVAGLVSLPDKAACIENHAKVMTADHAAHEESVTCLVGIAELTLPDLSDEDRAAAIAVMLTAGRQSELIHAGLELPARAYLSMRDPDHTQAEIVLRQHGRGLGFGWIQRRARHLLGNHWSEVETIAAALRRDGVFRYKGGADVDSIQ